MYRPKKCRVVHCAVAALVLVIALALPALVAAAGVPAGPRLTLVIDRAKTLRSELVALGPNGESVRRLDNGGLGSGNEFGERPIWNAVGSQMAFFGPGHETSDVFLINGDGSRPHRLVTSEHPGGRDNDVIEEPVYDPATGDVIVAVIHQPNGESLFGSERPLASKKKPKGRFREDFWALPPNGAKPHRLGGWALGPGSDYLAYPGSVAPDGELVVTLFERTGFSVGMVDPRSGTVRQITEPTISSEGVLEPTISPDGEEIVYKTDDIKRSAHGAPEGLRATELMVVPTAGGSPKRLIRVPGGARWPSWDPSGNRVAFSTLNAAGVTDWDNGAQPGNALMEVNADGTCLTEIYSLGKAGLVQGAGWQPGAGRGAWPISC
jgi:Tol biopolymer transport system component